MKSTQKIKLVEQKLAYQFRDRKIILRAFTHSSSKRDNKKEPDNERMEHLGDAVLTMIITDILFKNYPDRLEGQLTLARAGVCNNHNLAKTLAFLNLEKVLKLGVGQMASYRAYAALFEAMIAAVYLDGGFHSAFFVIKKIFDEQWKSLPDTYQNHKGDLQSLVQKQNPKNKVVYQINKVVGGPHSKIFTVSAMVNGKLLGSGSGKTKKEAQQNAAREAVLKFNQPT